jgi:GNAT superfamily N-acetyltransferase
MQTAKNGFETQNPISRANLEAAMLYDGPWADCIVALDPSTSAAFEQHLATSRQHANRAQQQFDRLPTLSGEAKSASLSAYRLDGALGVRVDGQIQAVALYSLSGTASGKHIMNLFVSVAEDYRRRGMATALLMHCAAIARQAGLRYLVHEDVDADALPFARLASAELNFSDGECQGWIELGPKLPAPARTELAGFRHA